MSLLWSGWHFYLVPVKLLQIFCTDFIWTLGWWNVTMTTKMRTTVLILYNNNSSSQEFRRKLVQICWSHDKLINKYIFKILDINTSWCVWNCLSYFCLYYNLIGLTFLSFKIPNKSRQSENSPALMKQLFSISYVGSIHQSRFHLGFVFIFSYNTCQLFI